MTRGEAINALSNIAEYWGMRPTEQEAARMGIAALRQQESNCGLTYAQLGRAVKKAYVEGYEDCEAGLSALVKNAPLTLEELRRMDGETMADREKLIELLEAIPHPQRLYPDLFVDSLIAHGVTVQGWIPVTERLPGTGKIVMVYDREKGIYSSQRLYTHLSGKPFAIEYSGGWRITHWMPLPEPPKGE